MKAFTKRKVRNKKGRNMTRVERNKGKYKKERTPKKRNNKNNNKNTIFKIVKGTFKILFTVIKWIVKTLFKTIFKINSFVGKMFMKLPRLLKVATIYGLIGLTIFGYLNPRIEIKEVIKEEVMLFKFEVPKVEAAAKEEVKTCTYGEIECRIYNKAIEAGMTKEQAVLLISISRHETGNWTSNAFKNKNNFGGIMCSTGLRTYASFEEGLNAFVNLLKNRYFAQGLNTIEKIGAVYCPVGAANDPTGVNKYWVPMVTQYYNEYLSK